MSRQSGLPRIPQLKEPEAHIQRLQQLRVAAAEAETWLGTRELEGLRILRGGFFFFWFVGVSLNRGTETVLNHVSELGQAMPLVSMGRHLSYLINITR